jgi:hypothetical protein
MLVREEHTVPPSSASNQAPVRSFKVGEFGWPPGLTFVSELFDVLRWAMVSNPIDQQGNVRTISLTKTGYKIQDFAVLVFVDYGD